MVSISKWVDQKIMVHLHNGILCSREKEGAYYTFCNGMDGTGEHYAKWNKPGGKGQIPYDLTFAHLSDASNGIARTDGTLSLPMRSPHTASSYLLIHGSLVISGLLSWRLGSPKGAVWSLGGNPTLEKQSQWFWSINQSYILGLRQSTAVHSNHESRIAI